MIGSRNVARRVAAVRGLCLPLCLGLFACAALGLTAPDRAVAAPARAAGPAPRPAASPEARLIEVYRQIQAGDTRAALAGAEALTRDVPNFQLAQLLYGDLLLARQGTLRTLGDAPAPLAAEGRDQLAQLRREATLRVAALVERPPAGTLPREFIDLPPATRHAIAVDASRSRLYLFENTREGLRLIADHYVSVGRFGVGKHAQGDQRTPLGIYFITSRLDPGQLQEFYGAGALTLNYPNEYDRRQGKTGHGIWLHGVPPQNFARSPQSTDGCVVLANDDMQRLLRDVSPRSTPVVISQSLQWVTPAQAAPGRQAARDLVERWRAARAAGDAAALAAFYSKSFSSGGADAAEWTRQLDKPVRGATGRGVDLKEVSILSWRDPGDVLVVTFGEVPKGLRTGPVKRQYWGKEGGQWKIFFEGVIG